MISYLVEDRQAGGTSGIGHETAGVELCLIGKQAAATATAQSVRITPHSMCYSHPLKISTILINDTVE